MAEDKPGEHAVRDAEEDTLAREELGRVLAETRGSLDKGAHPDWTTPQDTSTWVRALRADDDAATERKIGQPDRA